MDALARIVAISAARSGAGIVAGAGSSSVRMDGSRE
jgi:hypothetical protein